MDTRNHFKNEDISIVEEILLRVISRSGRGIDEKFPAIAIRPRFEAMCFAGTAFEDVVGCLIAKGFLDSEGELISLTQSGLTHAQR
jgi:hypothetical protein